MLASGPVMPVGQMKQRCALALIHVRDGGLARVEDRARVDGDDVLAVELFDGPIDQLDDIRLVAYGDDDRRAFVGNRGVGDRRPPCGVSPR